VGRIPGHILILFAITLVLANAGCFARCTVQSCQNTPPPCHSNGKSDAGHCPQQNQMKTAVIGAVTFDLGTGFIVVDWPAEVTQAEHPGGAPAFLMAPSSIVSPPPLALRI
jgi:hypothetical protein